MKQFLLVALMLLSVGCVKRDNPYDPDAENYDPYLQYASNTIRFSPDDITSGSATITLEIIKLESKASVFHLVFEDSNIVVESIDINSTLSEVKAMPLNGKNSCDIIAISPVTGTVKIADIHLSNIGSADNLALYFSESDSGTVIKNEVDNQITNIEWLTPTITQ